MFLRDEYDDLPLSFLFFPLVSQTWLWQMRMAKGVRQAFTTDLTG
jgi:hypothetical protein